MGRFKAARRTWIVTGVTAALVVCGLIGAIAVSHGSDGAPGDKHAAIMYSDGDYIKSLDDTTMMTSLADGAAVTVVDDYGNETPAEVHDGKVYATGTTVPRNEAGADALGVPWPYDHGNN